MEPHKLIWLQWEDPEETTWCQDKINDDDVGYVLASQYYELIMSVGNKHKGETRHETALRYIMEAEINDNSADQ